MKKYGFIILFLICTLLLASCGEKPTMPDTSPPADSNLQSNINANDAIPMQTPDNNIVYENKEQHYQLTFPESWRGWYIVDKLDGATARVKFYGKSKTGTIAAKDIFGGGLPMFFILPESELEENEPLDSMKKIGTAKGIDYYFATGTGSDVGALYSISDLNSAVRQTAKYEVDETELQLAQQDWEKVQQMQEQIDSVLKTFSEIE